MKGHELFDAQERVLVGVAEDYELIRLEAERARRRSVWHVLAETVVLVLFLVGLALV